ncbi:MAG: glycoside hydrolase family 9 protein [Oscillospiraceae bacterium]
MKNYEIYVNQAGYLPESKRKLAAFTAEAKKFFLCGTDGETLFSGEAKRFGFDECSGDSVWLADFSDFTEEGEYYLKTDSGMRSGLFRIGSEVYRQTFDDTVKAFYFLRCGCGLSPKYAGKFAHGKCHTAPAALWGSDSADLDLTGGWHDAGDYGRYVTAGAVAAAHLLYAYVMFPESFARQSLNIPESGGALPDILAEVKVELDWLLKMQAADGSVFHKATTKHHAAFVMPEYDNGQVYALPASSMAAADLSAVCALAHRVFKPFDEEYASRLLFAAERSAEWLRSHPEPLFINPEECTTGCYGERDDSDNRFWAWAELYCSTGEERYHNAMINQLQPTPEGKAATFPLWEFGCGSVAGFGSLAYLLTESVPRNAALLDKLRGEFSAAAEHFAAIADKCGYGAAMDEHSYGWGSNMNLMKRAMLFAIADRLCQRHELADYAEQQLHVLLGHNALGFSYVSGTGENCMKNPHLRPTAADGIDECIPGFVSGGANRCPADEDARRVIAKGTPPMKCYADIVGAFSLNEIAIYWNSPAVFLLAYLEDRHRRNGGQ